LKVIVDVILGNEANTAFPVRGRVIKDIEEFELGGMISDKLIKIVLEKDVLVVDIGIDEGNDCFVGWVTEDGTDDLDHGGKTGATGDHADMVAHAKGIDKVALGALDADGVSYVEGGKDTRNITFIVSLKIGSGSVVHLCKLIAYLDKQLEFSLILVARDGGITT